jgi:hypothetical protein
MYMYVHICIFMYMYIVCTYMLILVYKMVNMYVHVCTMFRHVCTNSPIHVHVVRIPDVLMQVYIWILATYDIVGHLRYRMS